MQLLQDEKIRVISAVKRGLPFGLLAVRDMRLRVSFALLTWRPDRKKCYRFIAPSLLNATIGRGNF